MGFGRIVMVGALATAALSGVACAPASVSGTPGGLEFDKMKTAYYDGDEYGITVNLCDYEWTCEEIQAAYSSDTDLTTEDPNTVVGCVSIYLTQYVSGYTFAAPTGPADFTVVDDAASVANVNEGDMLAFVTASFYNDADTTDYYDYGEVGTVTVGKYTAGENMSGDFSVTMTSDSAEINGKFKAESCPID